MEPNTVRNDQAALRLMGFSDRPVTSLTTSDLQARFNELRKLGYEPSTLELRRIQLGAFFSWCKHPENPAKGVEIAEAAKEEARAFTDKELLALRKYADNFESSPTDPPWRFWLELCLNTGARFGELMALEWSAFDRATKTVRIRQQIGPRGRGVKPLKGKYARTALVLPEFWRFYRRNATGRVLTPQIHHGVGHFTCARWANRFFEHAGIKQVGDGWHVWRHTYARLFLERGGSMEELQRSLGHASIKTTQDTYAHFSHDKAAAAAKGRIYAR